MISYIGRNTDYDGDYRPRLEIDFRDDRLTATRIPPRTRGKRPVKRQRPGARGQARILENEHILLVRSYIERTSKFAESDRVKFELSVYAGLRACEIAGLRIDDVTDADGRLSRFVRVRRDTAKGGKERLVPMHPVVAEALRAFRARFPNEHRIAHSNKGPQSAGAVTMWFFKLFNGLGLKGCSSHSGRRTFITRLSRLANQHNSSLRDVQLIAGHARLETTERYIEPAANLTELVGALDSASSVEDLRWDRGY